MELVAATKAKDGISDGVLEELVAAIADFNVGISEEALKHLARTMLSTDGDKDRIQDLFHWVPATLYQADDCTGYATVVAPPAAWNSNATEWGWAALAQRNHYKAVSSVLVPPGYKLTLYKGRGESKDILGRLREDEMGIFCHKLDDDWNDQVEGVRLEYYPLS